LSSSRYGKLHACIHLFIMALEEAKMNELLQVQ